MNVNLEGMKFNHLTVIKYAGTDKHQRRLWECRCDCGATTYATTSALKNGYKKSCGCLKHTSNANDLKGQRFGMLMVMKRVGTNQHRKALWKCKCDCGKTTTVSSIDLTTGNTKSCGCLGKNYAKRNLMKGGYWNGEKR